MEVIHINTITAIQEVARTAGRFQSSIVIEFDDKYIDAKSILGLFATLVPGKKYSLRVTGPDAEQATSAVKDVFEKQGFDMVIVEQ